MVSETSSGYFPTCTVIICTHNRPQELEQCLEGVSRLKYPRFEALVVDNAASDESAKDVAERWGARYVLEPIAGLSRARNRGAHKSTSEIVAYLDDDSVPEPDWLATLVKEFQDPLVIAATGRVLPFTMETEAEHLWAQIGVSPDGHGRRALDQQTPLWFEIANFGGIGDGGNMAFRRSVFNTWRGFDERLGRGALLDACEEHHAFFELLHCGYRIVYTSNAIVRHPYPRTLEELRERHLKALAASTGYFTLLLVEEPRYRRAVLKYLTEALRASPRSWRGPTTTPRPRCVPQWRALFAYLSGPLRYAQTRLTRETPPKRSSEAPRAIASIPQRCENENPPSCAVLEAAYRAEPTLNRK